MLSERPSLVESGQSPRLRFQVPDEAQAVCWIAASCFEARKTIAERLASFIKKIESLSQSGELRPGVFCGELHPLTPFQPVWLLSQRINRHPVAFANPLREQEL